MKNMFSDGDNANQVTTETAVQTAGSGSTQEAGYGSTQTAGYGSTQKAGIDSIQIGWWFDKNGKYQVISRKVTEKEADKPYKFDNGIWTEVKKKKVFGQRLKRKR